MNEIDYYEQEECAAIGQAIEASLKVLLDSFGVENVERFGRSIYRNTECGAWLSVKLHDGTWRHTGDLSGIDNGNVAALLVGSIVEGSDAEVRADVIELINYLDEGDEQRLVDEFNRTIDWVDDEACRLWDEANEENGK